jgi:hypothetical protein
MLFLVICMVRSPDGLDRWRNNSRLTRYPGTFLLARRELERGGSRFRTDDAADDALGVSGFVHGGGIPDGNLQTCVLNEPSMALLAFVWMRWCC